MIDSVDEVKPEVLIEERVGVETLEAMLNEF